MDTSVTSSSSASSITPLCNCNVKTHEEAKKLRLFGHLFATQELALAAIRHFRVVEQIFSQSFGLYNDSMGTFQIFDTFSDTSTLFSMNGIKELIRKKYYIVLVKNFPVFPSATRAFTRGVALPAVVVFTSAKGALPTSMDPAEDAVGYAVSRFPRIIEISTNDIEDAFVYTCIYKNIDHVIAISSRYVRGYANEGVIGGKSLLGSWFLELMLGNNCFALTTFGNGRVLAPLQGSRFKCLDGSYSAGLFHPTLTLGLAFSAAKLDFDFNTMVDHESENEIRALPENTSSSCLCAPKPGDLSLLQTQILEHTPIPVTIAGMILSYLGSWSLPLEYIAYGRYPSPSSA